MNSSKIFSSFLLILIVLMAFLIIKKLFLFKETKVQECFVLENFQNLPERRWSVWDGKATLVFNRSMKIYPNTSSVWVNIGFSPPIYVSDFSYIVIKYRGGIDMIRYRINNTSNDPLFAGKTTIHEYLPITKDVRTAKIPLRKNYGNFLYHLGVHLSLLPGEVFEILLC